MTKFVDMFQVPESWSFHLSCAWSLYFSLSLSFSLLFIPLSHSLFLCLSLSLHPLSVSFSLNSHLFVWQLTSTWLSVYLSLFFHLILTSFFLTCWFSRESSTTLIRSSILSKEIIIPLRGKFYFLIELHCTSTMGLFLLFVHAMGLFLFSYTSLSRIVMM